LDYTKNGQLSIDIPKYVDEMIENMPTENLKRPRVASTWNAIFERQLGKTDF
jgi:hypothetical protein